LLAAALAEEEAAKQVDLRLQVEVRAPNLGYPSNADLLADIHKELDGDSGLTELKAKRDHLYDQAIEFRAQLLEHQVKEGLFDAALENLDSMLLDHQQKSEIQLAVYTGFGWAEHGSAPG
jgi:hypothetical protein